MNGLCVHTHFLKTAHNFTRHQQPRPVDHLDHPRRQQLHQAARRPPRPPTLAPMPGPVELDEPAAETLRVGKPGRAVRLLVTAAVVGMLLIGSFWGDDWMFPFGPLRMYSTASPPSGSVSYDRLEAQLPDGRWVHTGLNPKNIGMNRAEVEGRSPSIVADPSLLRHLAEAHHRLHPHITLDRSTPLQGARAPAERSTAELHAGAAGADLDRVVTTANATRWSGGSSSRCRSRGSPGSASSSMRSSRIDVLHLHTSGTYHAYADGVFYRKLLAARVLPYPTPSWVLVYGALWLTVAAALVLLVLAASGRTWRWLGYCDRGALPVRPGRGVLVRQGRPRPNGIHPRAAS